MFNWKAWCSVTLLCSAACLSAQPEERPAPITIYAADTIILMTDEGAEAEAVAVADGLVLDTGTLSDLQARFPDAATDRRFEKHVIIPGLIDPHMHVLLGGMLYAHPFAPPWPMATPDGMMPGYGSPESFRARLEQLIREAPNDQSAIVVYGYHNLVQGDLDRSILDALAPDRPLFVWHYSAHDFYMNSAALRRLGATPDLAQTFHGVDLDEHGELTGRLYEDAAMFVFARAQDILFDPVKFREGTDRYFEIVRKAGVTTTADLGYGVFGLALEDATIAQVWSMDREGFRLFLVPEFRSIEREFADKAPQAVLEMVAGNRKTAAPVLPRVKFFADAAYYSQTMRLSPPGYLDGQSKGSRGLWVIPEGQIASTVKPYARAGLSVHIHSNGDEAQTATLQALETLRTEGFDGDFVIEHGGLFSPQQVSEAGRLQSMVSAASHYVYYMSGAYASPLGPARASWITPLGSLSASGAVVALHSDAPLAPPEPLRAAGAHITRSTREGSQYETVNALKPYDALEAVTLDAARVLGLERELGSIEAGKRADFTILARNPLDLQGTEWSEIEVWGVMLEGEPRPLPGS